MKQGYSGPLTNYSERYDIFLTSRVPDLVSSEEKKVAERTRLLAKRFRARQALNQAAQRTAIAAAEKKSVGSPSRRGKASEIGNKLYRDAQERQRRLKQKQDTALAKIPFSPRLDRNSIKIAAEKKKKDKATQVNVEPVQPDVERNKVTTPSMVRATLKRHELAEKKKALLRASVQKQKRDLEKKECTFKPRLCENSMRLLAGTEQSKKMSFYQRQKLNQSVRQKKLEIERKRKALNELAACTFVPTIHELPPAPPLAPETPSASGYFQSLQSQQDDLPLEPPSREDSIRAELDRIREVAAQQVSGSPLRRGSSSSQPATPSSPLLSVRKAFTPRGTSSSKGWSVLKKAVKAKTLTGPRERSMSASIPEKEKSRGWAALRNAVKSKK